MQMENRYYLSYQTSVDILNYLVFEIATQAKSEPSSAGDLRRFFALQSFD